MGSPILLNLLWNYKFLIVSLILFCICILQYNIIKKERLEFKTKIQTIELENSKQKHLLINKARELERDLNLQLSKNSEIKKEKDDKVHELNVVINDNSTRLQQLAKRAVEADKRSCTNTTTTKVVEKLVTVSSPERTPEPSREVDSNPTIEMLGDFERLSATCASNYERLKNESLELEGWADAVMNNSKIE